MNYSILNFLTLIGAVGMFLYGMKVMSEGLQKIAGDKMRNFLSAMPRTRLAGVITGFIITVLVQSSSASTTMVVSFVNAGLMSLGQSMAVIMGANVGTCATAWIISIFGFKVNIYAMAIPLLAFAVPMLFMKKSKWKSTGEFLIGFSFLFLGLQQIGISVPDLKSSPEIFSFLQAYAEKGFISVLIFYFVGVVVTMVVQSSAATFAIVLIMCSKGWIPFEMGCAIVLGSSLGTAITPVLASLGGNVAAKKAAFGHVLFNTLGSVWMLAIFFPFCHFIVWLTEALGQGNPTLLMDYASEFQAQAPDLYNKVMAGEKADDIPAAQKLLALQFAVSFGLSIYLTVYKLINFSVMIWFTNTYVKICDFCIRTKNKEDGEFQLRYISGGLLSASELNITQAEREISLYGERVFRMWNMVDELIHSEAGNDEFNKLFSRIEKYEEISDRMEIEIANYLNKVSGGRLSYESKLRISALLSIVTEIESIADSCYNIARTVVRKEEYNVKFPPEVYSNIDNMVSYIKEALTKMLQILGDIENVTESDLVESFNKEREINNYRNLLRNENIENINNNKYEYQAGIYYMDIICEAEKLGDYVVNVVEGVEAQIRRRHEPVPAVK
ncbi:MAG: Na/Pi cotransporter family protein [Muribaculaceae bacterium]|nr:Na/Pi cotransporter family protein [Muribaculaceae bacterium]